MIMSKKLTAEKIDAIKNFCDKTFDDAPVMTDEQLDSLVMVNLHGNEAVNNSKVMLENRIPEFVLTHK